MQGMSGFSIIKLFYQKVAIKARFFDEWRMPEKCEYRAKMQDAETI